MGIIEFSILYIVGALCTQNYLQGMKLVPWKVFLGVMFWFILWGYLGFRITTETIKKIIRRIG